ncbi:MAG: zinc-ribbon domain-containing protein, partial [Pseudomonadota bacterium]
MRLVCPSCSSEYQVDAAAIGERGRMVRCANCSAEWFQAPAPDAGVVAPPPPAPEPVAAPAPPPEPEFEPVIAEPTSRTEEFEIEEPQAASATSPEVERIYYDIEPDVVAGGVVEEEVEQTRKRRRRTNDREDLADSLRELEEDRPPRTGGAFLAGFSTVAVLAVILVAVYVKA